jgi:ABC-2 type transport system permease protein
MNTRSQIIGTYVVKIAITLLILVAAGFLYLRFDATQNKDFTLNKQTVKTLRGFKDQVTVKVFASSDLPLQLSSLNRSMKDMLDELQRKSRGKLRYEYVRGKDNKDLIEQAKNYGIQPRTAFFQENDKQVSKEVVFGVAFDCKGKTATMLMRPGMEMMLEYQMVKQLNKLQNDALPEITVFGDSLSLMFQYSINPDELATFYGELMDNYKVIHTDLNKPEKFTPVMFCFGVVDSLTQQQLYNLDQYLMQGGKVVMAQDRVALYNTAQGAAVVEIGSNLFRLLEHYGIKIQPNIVLDRNCEIRQGSGMGTETPYPFFPHIIANDKFDYTKGFGSIYMYFASQVDTMPGSKLKFVPVLRTSDHSGKLEGPVFQVEDAINRGLDPTFLNLPPITIAAEYSGKFTSMFTKAEGDSTFYPLTDKAKIILFGDSELPMDFSAGAFIMQNAIDKLLGRNEMIKLRSQKISDKRLGAEMYMMKRKMNPADPEKKAESLSLKFKLAAMLLPLLLLILYGFFGSVSRQGKD